MNVSLTAITPTTLHVSWQPPHTEEQNGEIITYTYIIADEEEEDVREGNSTELEVVIEELKPFQLYLVRLSAGTRVGMGPHSTPSLVEMPQDGMCVVLMIPHSHHGVVHRCKLLYQIISTPTLLFWQELIIFSIACLCFRGL